MAANSLMFPLTWSPLLDAQAAKEGPDLVDWSCSVAVPSCLETWGRPQPESSARSLGLALGCEDGTFYLFRPSAQRSHTVERRSSIESSASRPPRPSNSSRYGGLGLSNSRAGSPSSARSVMSPFQVSRTRAVSSVTTEQAEAPKNYVDFDEEAERMKGMLKGKSVKEKAPELLSPDVERKSSVEKDTRSPRVQALSPTPSTKSTPLQCVPSPSATPPLLDLSDGPSSVSLTCHVFPPKYGYLHAIRAFKPYDSGRYLICLQEAGYTKFSRVSIRKLMLYIETYLFTLRPMGRASRLRRSMARIRLTSPQRPGDLRQHSGSGRACTWACLERCAPSR